MACVHKSIDLIPRTHIKKKKVRCMECSYNSSALVMKIGGASGPTNLGLTSSRLVRKRVSKTRWTTPYKQHQIVPRPSHTHTPYSSGIHSHRHSCPHTYALSYTQTRMHYYMHYYIHDASIHVHMNIYVRTHFRKKNKTCWILFFSDLITK